MVISNLGILICAIIALIILSTIIVMSRYRKAKPNELLIKYGKVSGNKAAHIVRGNGTFVWPIINAYDTMSLQPIQLNLDFKEAISKENIRVDVPSNVVFEVSSDPNLQQVAVERLLGMPTDQLKRLVAETVYGQMRIVIAQMSVVDLNNDRETFQHKIAENVSNELKKYGLNLKTINILDVRDHAKIIENLGQLATAEADKKAQVNIATQKKEKMISIVEQEKLEQTKIAETNKDKAIAVAAAERDRQVGIAEANAEQAAKIAKATADREIKEAEAEKESRIGQNLAAQSVATSDAELAIKKADANKEATIGQNLAAQDIADSNAALAVKKADAEKTARVGANAAAEAIAESEGKLAVAKASAARIKGEADVTAEQMVKLIREQKERDVEIARAEKVEAKLKAETVVPAQIKKKEIEVNAEAAKQKFIIEAQGEAEAIKAKALAEAEAIRIKGEAEGAARAAILKAEADNFAQMLEASQAHPEIAVQFKMVDNYVKIAEHQADAYSNLRLGDVKVYGNADTAGSFMNSLMSHIAPTFDMLRSMPLPGKVQELISENKTNDVKFEEVKDDNRKLLKD